MGNLLLFLAIVVLGLLVVATIAVAKKHQQYRREALYPQGHWMGLGMSLGFFLGIPLGFIMGVAIEDVSFGIIISPAIGCAIGCALGSILEAKHKENIRPLTESERKRKKLAVAIGLVFLIAGVITFSGLLYLRR